MNDQELATLLNDLESDRVGRVWVRVGPRRATATQQEERRLAEKRRAKDLPFDILPLPSASLDDLDLDALQQLARNAVMHRIYENTYAPVRITWFNGLMIVSRSKILVVLLVK